MSKNVIMSIFLTLCLALLSAQTGNADVQEDEGNLPSVNKPG